MAEDKDRVNSIEKAEIEDNNKHVGCPKEGREDGRKDGRKDEEGPEGKDRLHLRALGQGQGSGPSFGLSGQAPLEKEVCPFCQRTHLVGEVCVCVKERKRLEKREALLEEKKNGPLTYRLRSYKEGEESSTTTSKAKGDRSGRGRKATGFSLHPLVERILEERGIEDVETFVKAPISSLIDRPMLNQRQAARAISRALDKGKKITIYGDYDVDGVTSVALGLNILRALGGQVDYYINDRFSEGFGIHAGAVEKISQRGTDLIITADNGISGIEASQKAKELGIGLIVTDHHEPNPQGLPQALVVDHKQDGCDYPNKELVGVGVLFKVLDEVCRLRGMGRRALHELDLVALGTVADVAQLVGENRSLVKNGLLLMDPGQLGAKKALRPGIQALREAAGLKETDPVEAYHLGFIFGPMINAEGRLEGSPHKAVELLTSRDLTRARQLAGQLKEINEKRKKLVKDLYEKALDLVDPDKAVFIIADPAFEEGVVGLLAGKLSEDFGRPAIVLTQGKDGRLKGSGRSVPGLNLKACLDKLAGLLVAYGGHSQACGLTVEADAFVPVKNMLETEVEARMGQVKKRPVLVDLVVEDQALSADLFEDMEKLAPFGLGFPRPRLMVRPFKLAKISYSRDKKHSRLSGQAAAGIDFWAFGQTLEDPEELACLVGTTRLSFFRGRKQLQFRIESQGANLTLEGSPDDHS